MKIIGHRGARGLAPENTVASLEKGLEHHVDELEFDLRVTADGMVVLHHNSKLRDANGRRMKIATTNYDELKEHKPDLATFNEALAAIDFKVPLYIEVKPRVHTTPIIAAIKQQLKEGRQGSNFLLGSKSQQTLLELHHALPAIKNIVIEPWSGLRATYRARQVDTQLISMNQLWLWRGFIAPMAKRGWKLYAYMLNNPKKARRWAGYGLYGVVTDYPDRFEKSR
jgi:glycerophosphoryl diester phosphodiesterase